MWCNVGFAEIIEFNKCYMIKSVGATFVSWEDFSKAISNKLDDVIYSIDFDNAKVTGLTIYSDDYLKKDLDDQFAVYNRNKEEFKKKYYKNFPSIGKKYYRNYYKILEFVGPILTAREDDDTTTININFTKKTVNSIVVNDITGVVIYSNTSQCDLPTKDTEDLEGTSGTAFFINNKGHLLTNNHVVEGCEVSKINYFNKEYDTNLIATDKTLDLALLEVELKPKAFISFSKDEPKKRDLIIIAGYPLGKYLSDDLKINEGKISSLKGFDNNSNEITVDPAINLGNSGGPIVNENGQLVAVAVSGMSKEVTEGISFGIKYSAVENFLKSNKIRPGISLTSFSMNKDKVNQLLEESTVYIFCE